jgi:nucleoside-diphosphate-sugar epimerase
MKELAKMIYQGEDELEFVTVKEYSDDVIIRIPDITKAQNELGFKPTKKIKDSIKICIQKIKDQKLV